MFRVRHTEGRFYEVTNTTNGLRYSVDYSDPSEALCYKYGYARPLRKFSDLSTKLIIAVADYRSKDREISSRLA